MPPIRLMRYFFTVTRPFLTTWLLVTLSLRAVASIPRVNPGVLWQ